MLSIFKNCLSLISSKQLKKTILILFGNQIGSILEVVGLGIIPVVAINLLDKEKLYTFFESKNLNFFNKIIELDNFILLSFIFLIVFFIFKNIYLMAMNYFQTKLRIDIFNSISNNFFQVYINSPYKYFLKKNPSYLSSVLTNEIHGACTVLEIYILLLKDLFTVLVICLTLILIDPIISSLVILFILIFTISFYWLFKKFLFMRGKIMQQARAGNLNVINQSFDIIKEAKILKKEFFFTKLFENQLNQMAEQKIVSSVLNMVPRPFLEIFSLIVISLILYYSLTFTGSLDTAIPFISFFAVSSIRLIPAFKSISNSLASINFNKISVDVVLKELRDIEKLNNEFSTDKEENIHLDKNFSELTIKDLNFSYDGTNKILKKINFKIKKGEKIGIIGKSGSGKSTLVNLILGLLKPDEGKILLDNENIFDGLSKWYDFLGYIPQDIYLINDTILKNIALGVDEDKINKSLVEKSLNLSNSNNFVNELKDDIYTNVGNRGISISGGQKQRIGIARALYKESTILILDEATNSLDLKNEKEIINQITSLKKLTVIIIAHNIISLKECDKLIYLDRGEVKDIGSFKDITNKYKLI